MVATSLNFGYNFITKALKQAEDLMSFSEVKRMLACLNIPMNLEEETEFREYLIAEDLVKVNRNDMLLDVDIKLDTRGFSDLLKKKIKTADPSANFEEFSDFPKDPKSVLNKIKNDLIESCLEDLSTRGKIFADKNNFIPEIKVKEIFYDIFPNFSPEKLNQFLAILENKRKASKLNYYQDSYNLSEIMYKIREGDSYRNEDMSLFKSTMRVIVAQSTKKKKRANQFNGELVGYG